MLTSHNPQSILRSGWTVVVWLVVVAMLLSGCGAQQPKVYRVGILSGLGSFATTVDGFKAQMTELGYVEGKNVIYDVQETNFEPEKEQQILKTFMADKVDLIFVFPTNAALEAKAVTAGTNIPVVFANSNIEGVDLVKSVREPGGNITGVRYPGPDLAVKRFEILHQIAPQAKRMWVPYQKASPIVPSQLEVLRPAAESVGVTLVEAPASNAADLQANLDARAQSGDIGIDAILLIPEPLCVTPVAFTVIGKFAAEHKLPVGGAIVSAGGYTSIFGVSTNNIPVGKQAAPLVDKIFKGISASTIPVVSAESYFQINYKVAQAQGMTVPEGLLRQASEVIR